MNIHVKRVIENKPELVLLHGWGTSSDIWQSWLPSLAEHFSITCIDLPGLGKSVAKVEEMSIDRILSAVAAEIPRNCVLLGWSLGGLIATLLVKKITTKIRALITIAYNPCFVQKPGWDTAMPAELLQKFSDDLLRSEQRALLGFFRLQVQAGSASKSILKQLKNIDAQLSHSQLIASLDLLKIDSLAELQQLKIPSLHIYGEQDQLAPAALSSQLKKLSKKISVFTVPGAGHLPFLSDADLVATKLLGFLAAIDNGER